MIDRVILHSNESYEFQTDGNQYVVVVSCADYGIEVYKGSFFLAKLDFLETYSCPANTGPYIIKNTGDLIAPVLLVRYILI